MRHRGGGHKRRYRRRDWTGKGLRKRGTGVVQRVDYDPVRSASVALVTNEQGGEGFHRVAASGRTAGTRVTWATEQGRRAGTRANGTNVALWRVPVGQPFYALELVPGQGATVGRSGGSARTVVATAPDGERGGQVRVRLPSGEQRRVDGRCRCVVGTPAGGSRWRTEGSKAAKGERARFPKGKAGRTRWLGRRPTVRGVARNPVDHPHGGGEGKTSGGRPSVSPWGVPRGRRTSRGRGRAFVVVGRKR